MYCSKTIADTYLNKIATINSGIVPGYNTAWIDKVNNNAYLLSGSGCVITASYNADDSILSVSEPVALTVGSPTPVSADENASKTKAFIWENLNNIKPLCLAEDISK